MTVSVKSLAALAFIIQSTSAFASPQPLRTCIGVALDKNTKELGSCLGGMFAMPCL